MKDQNRSAVFSPEAVASINRAYSDALRLIGTKSQNSDVHARLAETMMNLARCGATNGRQLRDLSVERTLGGVPAGTALSAR